MEKVNITISISQSLLRVVDEEAFKSRTNKGRAFNRSQFIEKALDQYLKVTLGLFYKKLRGKN